MSIAHVNPAAGAPATATATLAAAKALFERDDPARAEAVLCELRHREPRNEGAATLLAEVQRSRGCLTAAAETLLDVCRGNAYAPALSLRCVSFVQRCDRHAIAARICEGALARGDAPPELWALAGNVARESGDFDAARARYLAALDAGIDLDRHHVLSALANTRRYADAADPDLARFAAVFGDSRRAPRARASAGFALAKARSDLCEVASAAAALREANGIVHAAWPWQRDAWRAFVAARSGATIAQAVPPQDAAFQPVFIVGLPRTGTTLTATLLARATGARDRGELRALRYIADQMIAGGHLGSPAALVEAGALYRMLAVQDDAPATHYIDQDPLNFRYLDITMAMFPQAKVIHLRRDRRDTALSLWSQDFAHPDLAFAYDFADMHAFMAGHDALMAHWRQRMPLFELDYEALVTDTEATLSLLCDFIGAARLVESASGSAAPVQSASVWQARQPVYATSVGRWKHYAPCVPELEGFAPAQA